MAWLSSSTSFDVASAPRFVPPRFAVVALPHGVTLGSVSATLVGRTDELGVLRDTAGSALDRGAVAAVVLVGDPGIGKSRLLREAAERLHSWRRLWLIGREPERLVPLSAAGGLLRDLVAVPGVGANLDATLFGGSGEGGELGRLRIFEAAHRALRSAAPALLLVDDLQWADELSLALFHYLVRAAEATSHSLAVVVASRPCPAVDALAAALFQVLGDQALTRTIELGPLAQADSVRLVLELSPALGRVGAADLWEKAGGSPFWLQALVRAGGVDGDGAVILREQFGRLSADAAALLALLAVVARPMARDDVRKVQGWGDSRVAAAIRELTGRGWVLERAGMLVTAHDLVRGAAEEHLPADVRKRLHRRLAAWLEDEAGDGVQLLQEALEHRLAGGLPSLDLALRVACSPGRRLLGESGLNQLAGIADRFDPADPDALPLHEQVATLATELGSHAEALQRWAALAECHPDPAGRARAALAASKAAYELRLAGDAVAWLERAGANASPDAAFQMAVDAHASSVLRWLQHRLDEARALAQRAAGSARVLLGQDDPLTAAARDACLEALACAYDSAMVDERADQQLEIAEEMVEVARDLDARLQASLRAALALRHMGRIGDAEARFRRVLHEARPRVLPLTRLSASYGLARSLYDLGRLEEAAHLAAEGLELERRVSEFSPDRERMAVLAEVIRISRGDWNAALAGLEREADADPHPHFRCKANVYLAVWLSRLVGHPAAPEVSRRALSAQGDARSVNCSRCEAEIQIRAAEALARVGDVDGASALLSRWEAEHANPDPRHRLTQLSTAGLIARGRGDDSALTLLEASRANAEQLGLAIEALWCRIDVAAALVGSDRGRAAELLRETATAADRAGAHTEQGRAEQGLRSLGVRTWRRSATSRLGPAVVDQLTPREREVARLVISGITNAEAARILFLSPKTIERHLSNVMSKVGVRNRTELASLLGSEGDIAGPNELVDPA